MPNKWYITAALAAMVSFLLIASCRHQLPIEEANNNNPSAGGNNSTNSGDPCDPNTVYFRQQVLPILISNCAMSGCHDEASHQDGVILTSYASVVNTADVSPGNPGSSDLYEVLIDNDPDDRMPQPPQNPLSQQQIDIIYKWIQQGAKDLSCQSACDTTSFSFSGAVKNMIQNKCQGCHSGGAPQGGIDLSTYAGIKAKVDDGRLWGAINHLPGFSAMPKNGNKLSDCEITQIRKWIESGSPNN